MWEYNVELFQFMNELTRFEIIEMIVPRMADIPIFFLPLFLTSAWIYYTFWSKFQWDARYNLRENLMFIFYACVVVYIFSHIIKMFIYIDRPETAITEAGKLLLYKIPDVSFPSDHASISIAFLTALYFMHYKKIFWIFLPFVITMNFSRVVAWVHWPTDIMWGLLIWILAGYIGTRVLPQIKFVKKINSLIIKVLSYIKL